MTQTKAMIQIPEVIFSYKVKPSSALIENKSITSSKQSFEIFKMLWDDDTIELKEEVKLLFLNRNSVPIGYHNLAVGGITGAIADPVLIIGFALKYLAKGIVMAHNHPSGSTKSSKEDEEATRKIKEAAELFNIKLLDHLIVTNNGYYSFFDEGIL